MAAREAPVVDTATETTLPTIEASPQPGQIVNHEGKPYTTIMEGLAYILVPLGIPTSTNPNMSKEDTQRQQVFYNPIQQFNRDLSVLAIKTFGEDLVQRKHEKHAQQKKKNERKKKRADKVAAESEHTVEAIAEDSPSTKRKRDQVVDDQSEETTENRAKRMRTVESGHDVLPLDPEITLATMSGEVDDIVDPKIEAHAKWKPQFSILDALSATGLRALRYAKEVPFATSITANDMSSKATKSIALNVKHNRLEDKITANTGNAIAHMYSFVDKSGYDVIDLDPYGTAAPFIDSAIQAINDEGLLCVTCTDSAIFASHGYLEKTYSQYGGLPLKGEPCHEGGLRLLLHAVASSAGRYGMAIEPLLSLSIDYYIRVFVRIRKSPNDVKMLAGKTMVVYHCDTGCGAWSTQFLARNKVQQNKNGGTFYKHSFAPGPSANIHCEHCGFKTHLSGPMYGGPLHNVGFIDRVLAQLNEVDRQTYPTMDRMVGMLHTAREEITFGANDKASEKADGSGHLGPLIPKADPAEIDHHPFFFIPSAVSKVVHCSAPPVAALRGALRHAGFRATMSHCKPGSIKTDASWKDIWHIMLEWVRQKAPLKNELKTLSAGRAILSKRNTHERVAEAANVEAKSSDQTIESTAGREAAGEDGQGAPEANEADGTEGVRPSYLGSSFEVKFDEKLGIDHDRGKLVRYQLAPRENWGPMSRAK
ncbi:S-adenosyl-L-methionine-dependent methyltransferase [Massariosphaeria phaeospora]|uniref:tRNA (guanine(26)-N(2))-dimethyltransferase n=1 Tax=Massariosphaeria phaeospora TaxID=100035 RepID=A0A7C8M8J8_9PLEO|nr:S-adenosyl-L-methionine-dependent methyltransferase [Massariosphaeria phaeospora]